MEINTHYTVQCVLLDRYSAIVAKIRDEKQKTKQNWKEVENFDICVFVIFGRYCQKVISGGKTGRAMAQ